MCGWLRLLLQRRRWQGTRSMPFRLLVPFGLLCALLPLHHGAPGPDGTAPDPAHYRWRGSGSPPFHSWGMGIPDLVPSPFPPSQTTPPTCWDPATGLLAEIRWWLPFSALILVLSSAWLRLVALWLISRTPHQGASQGHVLPRLRQLPGECLSLRRAATSHLWRARHLGQVVRAEEQGGGLGLAVRS